MSCVSKNEFEFMSFEFTYSYLSVKEKILGLNKSCDLCCNYLLQ